MNIFDNSVEDKYANHHCTDSDDENINPFQLDYDTDFFREFIVLSIHNCQSIQHNGNKRQADHEDWRKIFGRRAFIKVTHHVNEYIKEMKVDVKIIFHKNTKRK